MALIKAPKISVIMPAYNSEKYIEAAVKSILTQTLGDFEFIIIDDGSTDGTWGLVKEFAQSDNRIVPVRNERNLKICHTLNKGLDMARGNYISRMDADDWSYP